MRIERLAHVRRPTPANLVRETIIRSTPFCFAKVFRAPVAAGLREEPGVGSAAKAATGGASFCDSDRPSADIRRDVVTDHFRLSAELEISELPDRRL